MEFDSAETLSICKSFKAIFLYIEEKEIEKSDLFLKHVEWWSRRAINNDLVKLSFDSESKFVCSRKVMCGIPASYRWKIWKNILCINELVEESFLTENSKYSKQIELDLPRTFPSLENFSILSDVVRRILLMSSFHLDTYYQGMNFLAGFITIIAYSSLVPQEITNPAMNYNTITENNYDKFTNDINMVFIGIMKSLGMINLYKNDFAYLKQLHQAFDQILQSEMPKVYMKFVKLGLPTEVFLHQWYLTLFLHALPLGCCAVLWDNIIYEGLSLIVYISIAIINMISKKIDAVKDLDSLYSLIKNLKFAKADNCELRLGYRITKIAFLYKENVSLSPLSV